MKLLTNEIKATLPALYSQESNPDPQIRVKFFTPWTNWTWYVIEMNAVLSDGRNMPYEEANREVRRMREAIRTGTTATAGESNDLRGGMSQPADNENSTNGLLLHDGGEQPELEQRASEILGVRLSENAESPERLESGIRETGDAGTGTRTGPVSDTTGRNRTPQGPEPDERYSGKSATHDAGGTQSTARERGGESPLEITDFLFFGMVHGHEKELGYFLLSELESIKGPAGLKIERDLHFGPKTLKEVK